jgi:hypothetical protein
MTDPVHREPHGLLDVQGVGRGPTCPTAISNFHEPWVLLEPPATKARESHSQTSPCLEGRNDSDATKRHGGTLARPTAHHRCCPGRAAVLHITADQARNLHRTIPVLVADIRQRLAGQRDELNIMLDLSAVPPTPAAAPLLFLVNLLRRITSPNLEIVVVGVAPALAAAMTAYDLPQNVTLVDTRGRRWPA